MKTRVTNFKSSESLTLHAHYGLFRKIERLLNVNLLKYS